MVRRAGLPAFLAMMLAIFTVLQVARTSAQDPSGSGPTTAPVGPSGTQITDEARPLLDKMSAAYRALEGLSVAGNLTGTFDVGGLKANKNATFVGKYRSPNQFRHEINDQDRNDEDITIGSTGQQIYVYLPERRLYRANQTPERRLKTGELPQAVPAILSQSDPSLLLAIVDDPADALTMGATKVSKSEQDIDGVAHPALVVNREGEDITVALHPETHLVRRVTIDLKRGLQKDAAGQVNTAMLTCDYTESKPNAQIEVSQFAWSPPEGATDIAAMQAGGDEPAMDLVGKAAPDFVLKDIDGKDVAMSSLKGSVVLLDFWATWCGPCVQSLPKIAEIGREQGPKGVKVYAVNLREGEAEVKQFLSRNDLTGLTVLLDKDGSTGEKYKADAIPQTVVVGKDGVVKKVIIGAGPASEQALRAAIQSALSEG
jgi:thiol-disulfide isomerase/thioredoxin